MGRSLSIEEFGGFPDTRPISVAINQAAASTSTIHFSLGLGRLGGGSWTDDIDRDGDLDVVAYDRSGIFEWEQYDDLTVIQTGSIQFDAFNSPRVVRDLNGDGVFDYFYSMDEWIDGSINLRHVPGTTIGNRFAGDANGDGVFNSSDLAFVFQAGRYESGESATFDQGDWNGDGAFDSADLVAVFQRDTFVFDAKPLGRRQVISDRLQQRQIADIFRAQLAGLPLRSIMQD
ncbi:MAG: hypothetical protein R3C28_00215 [Pirellulaceae bacterium]